MSTVHPILTKKDVHNLVRANQVGFRGEARLLLEQLAYKVAKHHACGGNGKNKWHTYEMRLTPNEIRIAAHVTATGACIVPIDRIGESKAPAYFKATGAGSAVDFSRYEIVDGAWSAWKNRYTVKTFRMALAQSKEDVPRLAEDFCNKLVENLGAVLDNKKERVKKENAVPGKRAP